MSARRLGKLRDLFNEARCGGRAAVATWHCSGSPLIAETVVANNAFDVIVLDLQHGLTDMTQCLGVLQAVGATPVVPFVRCKDSSPAHIHQSLDLGALGIIVPLIDTPKQASQIVEASSYPPIGGNMKRGSRSYGPVRASLAWGNSKYVSEIDSLLYRWAMIETLQGLENCEEIAKTPGIDGLFIGPNDLSLALGIAPSSAPSSTIVLEAMDRILNAAKDAGKLAGVFCSAGSVAKEMQSKGFHFVVAGTDTGYAKRQAATELSHLFGTSADGPSLPGY